MDGAAYLEKLIADRLGAGRGQPAAGRRSGLDLAGIRGVAVGLVAAGALGQQEMERIIADLEHTLESAGWLTIVRHTVTAGDPDSTIAPSMMARAGVTRRQWQEAIIDPPAPILRKVISLAGRTLTIDDQLVALLSLDVWSTMLMLRLAHHDRDSRTLLNRLDSGHRWRGWDDAGTQFRRAGGSGGGSPQLFIEEVVFEPGPAEQARTLTIRVEQDHQTQQLTIALDAPATPT
jgi:hypothetical protein